MTTDSNNHPNPSGTVPGVRRAGGCESVRPSRSLRDGGDSNPHTPGRDTGHATAGTVASPALVVMVEVPTVSGLNVREHWRSRSRRVKREREAVRRALAPFPPPSLPLVVELQRLGWNELDDDALPGALKAARDELCAWLGLPNDRRRPGLVFIYSQALDRSPARRVRDGLGRVRLERGKVRIVLSPAEVTA